ncbi:MAG: DUF2087 domain-containing protein [Clostridia bacterium]|nr:DUF2087 domain-containing protein [Clostridia bacterium]
MNRESFFNASSNEMSVGYRKISEGYECLLCGEVFEEGRVYTMENDLFEAGRAVKEHVRLKHGSVFKSLITLEKKLTGLTPHQIEVLEMMHRGLSDKEIIERISATSTATIRNLRFQLREREKQAKVFLATMEALRREQITKKSPPDEMVEIHKGATMVDDRYKATVREQQDTLETYFSKDGRLVSFPAKEKKKILVLKELTKLFSKDRTYHEKEVSEVLGAVYDDFAVLRRYLIEYGFMERNRDGSVYRLKD